MITAGTQPIPVDVPSEPSEGFTDGFPEAVGAGNFCWVSNIKIGGGLSTGC